MLYCITSALPIGGIFFGINIDEVFGVIILLKIFQKYEHPIH